MFVLDIQDLNLVLGHVELGCDGLALVQLNESINLGGCV